MSLRALIFDVDGTLADTEDAHRSAFNEAFEQMGIGWNWSRPTYAHLLLVTGGKERLAAHVASLPVSPAERRALHDRIDAIHEAKTRNYTRLVLAGAIPLRDGVKRLIEDAAHSEVRLSIATTTTYANVEALLCTCLGDDALDRFAVIGAGGDVARKKPAPDIYEYVLDRLNASADQCVAIEDSANGLRAAKAAGLCTIVTPSYWTHAEDFSEADLVLPALGSVDKPLPSDAAALIGAGMLGIREIEGCLDTMRQGK